MGAFFSLGMSENLDFMGKTSIFNEKTTRILQTLISLLATGIYGT